MPESRFVTAKREPGLKKIDKDLPLNYAARTMLYEAFNEEPMIPDMVIELLRDYNPFSCQTGIQRKYVVKYLRMILADASHLADYIISCLPDATECLPSYLLPKIRKLETSSKEPEKASKNTQTDHQVEYGKLSAVYTEEKDSVHVFAEDELDSLSQSEPKASDTSFMSNSSITVTNKHNPAIKTECSSHTSSEISLVSPSQLNPQLNFSLTEEDFCDIRVQILQEEGRSIMQSQDSGSSYEYPALKSLYGIESLCDTAEFEGTLPALPSKVDNTRPYERQSMENSALSSASQIPSINNLTTLSLLPNEPRFSFSQSSSHITDNLILTKNISKPAAMTNHWSDLYQQLPMFPMADCRRPLDLSLNSLGLPEGSPLKTPTLDLNKAPDCRRPLDLSLNSLGLPEGSPLKTPTLDLNNAPIFPSTLSYSDIPAALAASQADESVMDIPPPRLYHLPQTSMPDTLNKLQTNTKDPLLSRWPIVSTTSSRYESFRPQKTYYTRKQERLNQTLQQKFPQQKPQPARPTEVHRMKPIEQTQESKDDTLQASEIVSSAQDVLPAMTDPMLKHPPVVIISKRKMQEDSTDDRSLISR